MNTVAIAYGVPQDRMLPLEQIQSWDGEETILAVGEVWHTAAMLEAQTKLGRAQQIVPPHRPDLIHRGLVKLGGKKPSLEMVCAAIRWDLFQRSWYAYPLLVAALQAQRMKLKSITAVEFGVWRGEGLLNMARLASVIEECLGVAIRVAGFDAASGLPSVADWRDHPELWYTGELAAPDTEGLRQQLPENCELIIGDIADTLAPFLKTLSRENPLGFISLDVDTYSSSVAALKALDVEADHLLPATLMYVDDAYINIMQSKFCGEGLAIAEFNASHDLRKIDQKVIRTDQPRKPWHHAIHFAHVFDHWTRREHAGVSFIGLNVHAL